MDPKTNKLIAMILALGANTVAFGQGYQGSMVNLNEIFNPPMEIQGIICQQYKNDGNEHSYTACSDGVSAARFMAEKYAQSAGSYLGCLDGFYQGTWDGYQLGSKLSIEQINQAQSEVANVEPISARTRAEGKATTEVITESADQIIKRYRGVIGKIDPATGEQMLPDKSYNYPEITFRGYNDGYDYDISSGNISGQDFSHAYNSGWVSSSDSFEDRISAKEIWFLQGEHASNVCDNSTTMFGKKKMVQLTLWDFYKARRQYDFESYGWDNADWSWNFFDQDERNLSQYQNYEGISNYTKKVSQEYIIKAAVTKNELRAKTDSNGNAVVDAEGKPVMEMVTIVVTPAVIGTRMVDQKLSTQEVNDLKALYQKGFKESYSRYYAKQYASLSYHKEGQRNYATAQMIGRLIGEKVSTHMAKKNAYDNRYREVSLQRFTEKLYSSYEKSFDALIDTFEKHAVVEFNSMQIFGVDSSDEIFKSGEGLKATIKVTNLGEKAEEVKLRINNTSDVVGNNQTFGFYPASLKESFYTSNEMGHIANSVMARETVDVGMYLTSPLNFDSISSVLTMKKNQKIGINEEAEIDSIDSNIDLLSGGLSIKVNVYNASAKQTTALPKVIVNIDTFNTVIDKDMMHLSGRETRPVSVTLSNLDPLTIIAGKKISGTVSTQMNGRVLHTKSFTTTVSGSTTSNYVKYFHALASGSISNSGNQSTDERIATLMNIIEDSVSASLASRVNWRKQSQVEGTIIAEIQKTYQRAVRNGEIGQAQEYYDRLASSLAKFVGKKGKGIKVRRKKKYLQALAVFSPSLSTKVKNHK